MKNLVLLYFRGFLLKNLNYILKNNFFFGIFQMSNNITLFFFVILINIFIIGI